MNARLYTAISAACPVVGVSVGTPGDIGTVRIDYGPAATAPQRAAAEAALAAFDWSDAAQSAWELSQTRTAALTGLLTRGDDIAIGVRAITRAITTLVNDRLAAAGQSRVLEAEILAFINSNPTIGDPVTP